MTMKVYSLAIVAVVALALGGVFGFSLGSGDLTADSSQPAAGEASSAAESRVGAVGVLQAISREGLSLQTRDGIQFMTITGPAAGIDQLKVGDKVAVWAQTVNGQLAVRQIVVVPETPQRMHYLGLVANVAADRIDVVGKQGETTSFRADAASQWMPDASRAPQVGDTVTVVAKPDPLGDGWLAIAVVIR
jgi:hypothetical protein